MLREVRSDSTYVVRARSIVLLRFNRRCNCALMTGLELSPCVNESVNSNNDSGVANFRESAVQLDIRHRFLNDLLRDGYIPLVQLLSGVSEVMDVSLDLVVVLIRLGLDVVGMISGKTSQSSSSEEVPQYRVRDLCKDGKLSVPSSVYKIANTIWAGICSVWGGMSQEVSDALETKSNNASTLGIFQGLLACMEACLDGVKSNKLDDDTGSKVLKFIVSNLGKIIMCGSSDASVGIASRLWDLVLAKGQILEGRDKYNSIDLLYRAIVVSLNSITPSDVNDGEFYKSVALSLWAVKEKHVVFNSVCHLWKASVKMESRVFRCMIPVIESMFKCLTHSNMQKRVSVDPGIISSFEDSLVQLLSCHLNSDPTSGMNSLFAVVGFIVCPHPLIEEVLSRVSMRIMTCAGDGFQLKFVTLVMDILNNLISIEPHGAVSPTLEQCIAVASAAISCCSQSTIDALINAGYRIPVVQTSIDIYSFAQLSVFLRVLYLSSVDIDDTKGSANVLKSIKSADIFFQKILDVISTSVRALRICSPPSEDEILLLFWISACLFWTSTILPEKRPLGNSNRSVRLDTSVEMCFRDLALVAEGMCDAANKQQQKQQYWLVGTMAWLERTGMQIARMHIPRFVKPKTYGKKQHLSLLERFDTTSGVAGWIVHIAPHQQQRPLSAMKKMFSGALDEQASAPLQHLGMNSYIEYMHYASEDNMTSVLPQDKIDSHTGNLSDDFKKQVERYVCVIKNLPTTRDLDVDMQEIRHSMFMSDVWESLAQHCADLFTFDAKRPRPEIPATLQNLCPEDISDGTRISNALEHARASLKDLVAVMKGSKNQGNLHAGMKRTFDEMHSDLTWLQSQL